MPTSTAGGDVRGAIDAYFAGERRDALFFTLIGAANLGAALAVLLAVPGQRLLALALAVIGLLEAIPGFWALRRQSIRQSEALERNAADPAGWRAGEISRLERVLDARRRLRIADAAFFLAFVVVVIMAPPGERLTWLVVPGQMAILPLLNVAMERRNRRFLEALRAS
jgi:hypothetical protein